MSNSTANKPPAFQWYPDKWLTDTRRLPWAVKGLYKELLDVIWLQFQDTCSIPDQADFIAAELGCTIEEWEMARDFIMLSHRPLMIKKSGCLFSKGLWKEHEKQRKRRKTCSDNGKLGGRPRGPVKQRLNSEKPNGKAKKSSPSPSPIPSPAIPLRGAGSIAEGLELWEAKEAILDPDNPPIPIIMAVTREKLDTPAFGFYAKALIKLGEKEFRDIAGHFIAELDAGETVRNRGATFTAKLKRFMEALGKVKG